MNKLKALILFSIILTMLTGCFEEKITSDKRENILNSFVSQNAYGFNLTYVDTVDFKDTGIIPNDETYDYYRTDSGAIYKITVTSVNSYTAKAEKYKDETKKQYYITIHFGYKRYYDEEKVLTSQLNNTADTIYLLSDGTEYDGNRYCYKEENICTTEDIYARDYFDSYSSDRLFLATETDSNEYEFVDISANK